jgi:hypothetical protein
MREREEHGRKERVKREISLGYCYKSDERERAKRERQRKKCCVCHVMVGGGRGPLLLFFVVTLISK